MENISVHRKKINEQLNETELCGLFGEGEIICSSEDPML